MYTPCSSKRQGDSHNTSEYGRKEKRQGETQKCIHISGSPSFTPCLGVFKLFKLVELCGLWQVSVIRERCFVKFLCERAQAK